MPGGGLSIEVCSVGEIEWHESGVVWLSVNSEAIFSVSSIRMVVAWALLSAMDCHFSVKEVRALNIVM